MYDSIALLAALQHHGEGSAPDEIIMGRDENEPKKPRGRGRPFRPGESGNPAGRPQGSKNLTKLLLEKLDARADELIDSLIERALKGDAAATKIISDRVMPVQKGSFVDFVLPERLPDGSMDIVKVQENLLEAVALGKITPADAAHISMIFDKIMSARNEIYFHDQVFDMVDKVQKIEKLIKE